MLVFQNKAFSEEKKTDDCKIIFYAETVYADKEAKLCEQGDKITYEFKNKNSSDSIIKVTGDRNQFYITKVDDKVKRVWVDAGDIWYALEEDGGDTTVWGYDGTSLDVKERSISKLKLRYAVNMRFRTLIFNRSLVENLEEFDQWRLKEID